MRRGAFLAAALLALPAGANAQAVAEAATTPGWLVVPFVILLGMIAAGPVLFAHHWHRHYPKYAAGLALLVAAYVLGVQRTAAPLLHAAEEYTAFIALLGALYVAAGGILIQTDFAGTPRANVLVLLVGAVLANLVGTMGASVLLIRPFLRLNVGRLRPYHVAFFIFLVSNVGGALTPIGDPPLFLGFLRGVPFFWTLVHLTPVWAFTVGVLLLIFYVIDRRNTARSATETIPEARLPDETAETPLTQPATVAGPARIRIVGKRGFAWLALVIACVFVDPKILPGVPDLHALGVPFGLREILLAGVAVAAYRTADRRALAGNGFTFEPIREVAWLFAGLFVTMQPALKLISAFAREHGERLPIAAFYFGTGVLSALLDNAPTYLAFLAAAMARFGLDVDDPEAVRAMATGLETLPYVEAVAVAAVFWGAVSYIGNGPNFMVRAIAEAQGAPAPSFFGYFFRYALPVLVPVYVLVWFLFLSGYVPFLASTP